MKDSGIPRFNDGFADSLLVSQIPRFPESWTNSHIPEFSDGLPDAQIPRFLDSEIFRQNLRLLDSLTDSRIPGFLESQILGLIPGFPDSWIP